MICQQPDAQLYGLEILQGRIVIQSSIVEVASDSRRALYGYTVAWRLKTGEPTASISSEILYEVKTLGH